MPLMLWLPVVTCITVAVVWALLERAECVALLVCAACALGAWQKHSGRPLPDVAAIVRDRHAIVRAIALPAPASP